MDVNANAQRIRQNLTDAGIAEREIAAYMRLGENEIKQKLKMLYGHRKKLLEDFHFLQREIDCLDYLIRQVQNGGETR